MTRFPLTPTWHPALHLCCLNIQVTKSPDEGSVSPQFLAILMLLLLFESSKCFLTSIKKTPALLLFPWPNKPQIHIPSHMYLPLSWLLFFNSGGCPWSQSPMPPILVLIVSNYFLGSLTKIQVYQEELMYDYPMYDLMRRVLTPKISAGFLHHHVNFE